MAGRARKGRFYDASLAGWFAVRTALRCLLSLHVHPCTRQSPLCLVKKNSMSGILSLGLCCHRYVGKYIDEGLTEDELGRLALSRALRWIFHAMRAVNKPGYRRRHHWRRDPLFHALLSLSGTCAWVTTHREFRWRSIKLASAGEPCSGAGCNPVRQDSGHRAAPLISWATRHHCLALGYVSLFVQLCTVHHCVLRSGSVTSLDVCCC